MEDLDTVIAYYNVKDPAVSRFLLDYKDLLTKQLHGVIIGSVETFEKIPSNKEQLLKVFEEMLEVYSAWESGNKDFIVRECADVIQALCNFLASIGVKDMTYDLEECKRRNIMRGRKYND